MARITGAYNRRKRKTKKPVTTSKGRSNRQKVSKAEVSDGNNRKVTGTAKVTRGGGRARVTTPKKSFTMGGDTGRRGGTNQPATAKSKVPTQGRPKAPGKFKFKIGKAGVAPKGGMRTGGNNLRARGTAALAAALATGALRNPVSKAKSKAAKEKAKKSIGKFNTRDADGTVRSRKKVGAKKVGPKKVGPKKVGTIAESFDKAFAAARKAGKKEFTFKGKRYNTKMA